MSSGSMRKVIFQFYGYLCTSITQVNFDLVIEYLIKYLYLLARSCHDALLDRSKKKPTIFIDF